jgi:hypothetical protein
MSPMLSTFHAAFQRKPFEPSRALRLPDKNILVYFIIHLSESAVCFLLLIISLPSACRAQTTRGKAPKKLVLREMRDFLLTFVQVSQFLRKE